jgi:hypothetical protein
MREEKGYTGELKERTQLLDGQVPGGSVAQY